MVRVDLVTEQFGEFLEGVTLPVHWREEVHRRMVETLEQAGHSSLDLARERERLKLKRARILKQHRDGYISDRDLQTEVAAVDFALSKLAVPEADGVKLDAVIEAGECLPGIAALWKVATVEERRELVALLFEPGGFYYDLELKLIAALKPRPVFLPIFRLIPGLEEYNEARGTLVTVGWQERNRRAGTPLRDNTL